MHFNYVDSPVKNGFGLDLDRRKVVLAEEKMRIGKKKEGGGGGGGGHSQMGATQREGEDFLSLLPLP